MNDQVVELERLAEADHRAAIALGHDLLPQLTEPALQARAHRALGNSHRALADLDAAFDHYRRGIGVARGAKLEAAQGLILMSRAGAHSMAGNRTPALRDLTRAERLTTGPDRARVLFQRAVVIQRFSEGADALATYHEVIPLLAAAGDDVFLAHALSNRGLIHTYQGDQEAARTDFEAALGLYLDNDLASPAAVVEHNLGLVHTRMHDIPGALARFDEAEQRLNELGRPLAGLRVDRAETLLSAGLVDDARELADATVSQLDRLGLRTDRAEALLVSAHAALVAGEADASDLAARAAAEFQAQARPGWRDRAHILRLEALAAATPAASTPSGNPPTQTDERFARRLSQRLAAAGHPGPASRAALVEGLLALRRGATRAATASLARGAYSRRSGLVEEQLAYWAAASSIRLAQHDRRGAMAAARAGLDALGAFRGHLAAVDTRAGVAVHAERLIATGLTAARSSAPRTLFDWLERTAAAYEVADRTTVDPDPQLSVALDQFRSVVQELTSLADPDDDPERQRELQLQRRRLEATIKRHSRRLRGTGQIDGIVRSGQIDEAVALADGRQLLAFAEVDGRAVRCHGHHGRFTTTDLGPVADLAKRTRALLALLRRMAVSPTERRVAGIDRALDDLGRALVGGLDLDGGDLVILPRGPLGLVPWQALPQVAASTLTVSPSLATWARTSGTAAGPGPGSAAGGQTTIVVGPRLDNAGAEAAAIAAAVESATVIETADATTEAALDALRHSRTVHFVCHGTFRSDNPLFSHLELADGPLTVFDILDLGDTVAETVVLSACSGAQVSSRPERAFIGMSGAFLAIGIRSLVASVSPVQDAAGTRQLMTAFHHHQGAGLSPRASLAAGLQTLSDPVDRVLASPFLTMGAG